MGRELAIRNGRPTERCDDCGEAIARHEPHNCAGGERT